MLGIFTDNHHVAVTLDNLALVADLLYGRFYFHSILPPFSIVLSMLQFLVRHVILPLDGS